MKHTAKELIAKYNIVLAPQGQIMVKNGPQAQKDGVVTAIRAAKAEIIAELQAEKAAKDRAAKEAAQTKLAAIPGLKEYRDISKKWTAYLWQEKKAIAGDGTWYPRKPNIPSMDEMITKYPVAAAYCRAQSWADSSHNVKATAGRKAMERLVAGEDYQQVLAEMEEEWAAYCRRTMWE